MISACNNSELSKLRLENQEFKKTISLQEKRLKSYENSVVIPYDSLNSYILPMTYYSTINTNEAGEFITTLAWRKLPDNMKVSWSVQQGEVMNVDKGYDNLNRYVTVKYNLPGEYEIRGTYKLEMPNGTSRENDWKAFIQVEE